MKTRPISLGSAPPREDVRVKVSVGGKSTNSRIVDKYDRAVIAAQRVVMHTRVAPGRDTR